VDPSYNPTQDKELKKVIEARESAHGPQGFGGTHLSEDIPSFNILSCEKVIKGQNNAWIVLGRDRPAGKESGAIGSGASQSGMIDLCVGRLSALEESGSDILADPDFSSDAARVYLTQKGNVDQYFGLAKGSEEIGSKDRSAVALKADHVRIVGKNHIKIVTGRARISGAGRFGERTSRGGRNEKAGRIDLIAGNHTTARHILSRGWFERANSKEKIKTLQSVVKGDNLVDFLNDLILQISNIVEFCKFNSNQIAYLNTAVAKHWHPVAPLPSGVPVATQNPALFTICSTYAGLVKTKSNLKVKTINYNFGTIEANYLGSKGSKYINSYHVNTT
jgi:hypothetical protein